jgi:hypothetical protein
MYSLEDGSYIGEGNKKVCKSGFKLPDTKECGIGPKLLSDETKIRNLGDECIYYYRSGYGKLKYF